MDYAVISSIVKSLVDELDHHHLGTWSPVQLPYQNGWAVRDLDIYPSSENLLWWIGERLLEKTLDWSKLALEETCTSYAELTREEFNAAHVAKVD